MPFKTCVSLLIFCLHDLSTDVSEVLKSHTVIVLVLISLLRLLAFYILRFSCVGYVYINIYNVISSSWIDHLIIMYCLL